MSLTAGTRLGPDEILAHLGAGGMGEVADTRFGVGINYDVTPDGSAS
jgi:hypothetical protein